MSKKTPEEKEKLRNQLSALRKEAAKFKKATGRPPAPKPAKAPTEELAKDTRKVSEILQDDPGLTEQLAAWFSEPAPHPGELPEEDDPWAEVRKRETERRQAAEAAIDPDFLSKVFPQQRKPFLTFRAFLEVRVDPNIPTLASLQGGPLEEVDMVREARPPRDIAQSLDEDNTPQATLRDLHRSERQFERRYEVQDLGASATTPLHRIALEDAREKIREDYSVERSTDRVRSCFEQIRAYTRNPHWQSNE
jgi:hypothetical protein